jgi:hypothetical protein
MKQTFFLLLLATVILSVPVFAQDSDSAKPQQVDIKITVDNKDSIQSIKSKTSIPECETCNTEKVKSIQWLLVFLPALVFFILFYYFMGWLKKDGFKIADALASCEPVTLTEKTKDAAGLVTVETETNVLPKSSSRLIAFLTGLTAMTIGLSLVTYYIFITLADCPNPNLDDLWKVIASLGIGIIPYGANMWKESQKAAN